jgi:IS5 family transposase
MMFLLFWDDVASERLLMRTIPERLDYMWFLGFELDDQIPNHSVLSKARNRWARDAFESFFVQVVHQCVEAGLVDGSKVHMDGSLVDASASNESVFKGPAGMIAALKDIFRSQEAKLDELARAARKAGLTEADAPAKPQSHPEYERVNDGVICRTDPDAPVVRQKGRGKADRARPRYKNHRAVDDVHGVITSTATTPGNVDEGELLEELIDGHQQNTGHKPDTVVADSQYGTNDNFRRCANRGIHSHMADRQLPAEKARQKKGLFTERDFVYSADTDTYTCPAGQVLRRRRHKKKRHAYEYALSKKVCNACALKSRCTESKHGRSVKRHENHEAIEQARKQARSNAARNDRRRRATLMEGSFADAANNHGFKKSRWRGLWRQQIQDLMIAAVQNVKILIKTASVPTPASELSAWAHKTSPLGSPRPGTGLAAARCGYVRPFGTPWRVGLANRSGAAPARYDRCNRRQGARTTPSPR